MRINDEFMESFKSLDKLCKELFNSEKGVTSYIDTMVKIQNGSRYVSNWNYTLSNLRRLRHIRNSYAHEVGTSYKDICTPSDIKWINDFRNSIIKTTDPLALYRQATHSKAHSAKNRGLIAKDSYDYKSRSYHYKKKYPIKLAITLIMIIILIPILFLFLVRYF